VNLGCVPKKIMWNAATLAESIHDASGYGFDVSIGAHDWRRLKHGRDEYVRFLNGVYRRNLDAEGVTLAHGFGRFVDSHTVEVGDTGCHGEHVLVATGGRPRVPQVPGADLGVTSDGFFELPERPEKVAVIGGGYIAVEI